MQFLGCWYDVVSASISKHMYSCFDSMHCRHTFSHELGHNFGARHSRFEGGSEHEYGHGYRDPSLLYRTLMTYDCPGGCIRFPYFSADGYAFMDLPIGTPTENNARILAERAAETAGFM